MSTENTPVAAPTLGAILSKTIAPSAWVEFKEGITFNLRYLPKARFRALADQTTEMKYDEKLKIRTPKLNSAEFTSRFLREAVLGWKGVTLRSLSKVCEIDLEGHDPKAVDVDIAFSAEEMSKLLELVYDLDTFINQSVTDIKTFRPTLEEEAKNSKAS